MRKTVLIIILGLCVLKSKSQDAEKYLITGSKDTTILFAKMMSKATEGKFKFAGQLKGDVSNVYTYGFIANNSMTIDEMNRYNKFGYSEIVSDKHNTLVAHFVSEFIEPDGTIDFGTNHKNEKGKTVYFFSGIWGSFANLFSVWKQFFNKNATQEDCLKETDILNHKGDEITITDRFGNKMLYRFTQNSINYWSIHKDHTEPSY